MKPARSDSTVRFVTDAGIEVQAVSAGQMRELDRIAMEETGPNLFQMMENAGRTLAQLALEVLSKQWAQARVVVLAGTGGNGGGGICAARHLANRHVRVRLCLVDPARLGAVTSFQRRIFHATSGTEVTFAHLDDEPVDLIVDALLGYSLTGAPRGMVADLIRWANGKKAPILALDLPSGLNPTTGETPGEFVRPRWTLTLALPKSGLLPSKAGALFLADVGIPERAYSRMGVLRPPHLEIGSGFPCPIGERRSMESSRATRFPGSAVIFGASMSWVSRRRLLDPTAGM